MNLFKKSVYILAIALSASFGTVAVAQEAGNSAEIVSHLEKAVTEVGKSDFSAAQIQLKAARTISDATGRNTDTAQKAHALIIQSQIQVKIGDISKSTALLNQAIALFKGQ